MSWSPIPDGPARPTSLRAWYGAAAVPLAGVDLVHAHGLKAGWVASAVPGRPPLVLTVHNVVLAGRGGRAEPLAAPARGAACRERVDEVIATSPGLAARSRRAGAARPLPASCARRAAAGASAHAPAEVRAALGLEAGSRSSSVSVASTRRRAGRFLIDAAARASSSRHPSLVVVSPGRVRTGTRSSARCATPASAGDRAVRRPARRTRPTCWPPPTSSWRRRSGSRARSSSPRRCGWAGRSSPRRSGSCPTSSSTARRGGLVPVGDVVALARAIDEVLADPPGAAGAVARPGAGGSPRCSTRTGCSARWRRSTGLRSIGVGAGEMVAGGARPSW